MFDLSFGIHIILLTLAISASYAVLMSVLKKEPNAMWLRGETLTAMASGATALAFGFQYLTGEDTLLLLSSLLLVLGLANTLGLAIVQFKNVTDGQYPAAIVPITRTLGIVMFITFTASFLIELAALGRS